MPLWAARSISRKVYHPSQSAEAEGLSGGRTERRVRAGRPRPSPGSIILVALEATAFGSCHVAIHPS
jgi:hypothetical protein